MYLGTFSLSSWQAGCTWVRTPLAKEEFKLLRRGKIFVEDRESCRKKLYPSTLNRGFRWGEMTRFVPGYAFEFETSPVGQKRTRVLSSENKKDTPPPVVIQGATAVVATFAGVRRR